MQIEQAWNHCLGIRELNVLCVSGSYREITADSYKLPGAYQDAGIANSLIACRCEQPSASYEYVTLLWRVLRCRKIWGDEKQKEQYEELHLRWVAVLCWPCTSILAGDAKRI
jgi:hypothetical protein